MNARLYPLIVAAVSATASLNAAVLTVTSLGDSAVDPGCLRNQVSASSGGDTIQFAVTGTILLSSAITIDHSLTIQGPGPANLIVDANHVDRAFYINISGGGLPTNSINGMTITDGLVTGTKGADGGTGQNGSDGGDAFGGGIYVTNAGQFTVTNCWLVANALEGGQGGEGGTNVIGIAYFRPGNGGQGGRTKGGAVYYFGSGPVAFVNCTFSDNRAVGGGGGKGGTNIDSSLDTGGTGGQGGSGQSGAVDSDAYFENCTFSQNRVSGGRGGAGGDNIDGGPGGTGGKGGDGSAGASQSFSGASFESCTIVSNLAFGGPGGLGGNGVPQGAGGSAGIGRGGALVGYTTTCFNNQIANTIVADNFASTSSQNYYIAFDDGGHNFIGLNDCACCPWGATSQVGNGPPIHPQLLPLAQNGGGLPTHAPALTSPVIDQGYSLLATDERGAPRVYDWSTIPNNGNGADIGAFELGTADLGAALISNNLVLSWPGYYGDFVLQSAAGLQGSNTWSNVPVAPVVISNQFVVTIPMTNALQFYRMAKP
jgi:hypothetical protein